MAKEVTKSTIKTSIFKKLHLVMGEIDRVEKDARNTHQNYDYASEKAIKEAVHPVLVKHGVLFYVETSNLREEYGKTLLDVIYHFVDVDSDQELTGVFIGTGQNRDEKGNYSAVTGAIKYILTSTFLIPTGDDPEDDKNEVKKTTVRAVAQPAKANAPLMINPAQVNIISNLLEEKGYTEKSLLIKYAIKDLKELTKDQGATVILNLQKIAVNPKKVEKEAQEEVEPEIDLDEVDAGIEKMRKEREEAK